MNDRAKIVLWLGLIMILFQIVKDWQLIKTAIFTGSSSISAAASGGGNAGSAALTPGQQLKQGETSNIAAGRASNCPPGFPPGIICEAMLWQSPR